MLLALSALVACSAALLRGGSVRGLASLHFRAKRFIFTALVLQMIVYIPGIRTSSAFLHWSGALYISTFGLILVAAAYNWSLGPAFRLIVLGLALNTVVILVNGGHMPVNPQAMRIGYSAKMIHAASDTRAFFNVRPATASTRLTILEDNFPSRPFGQPDNVYSIGDVLIAIGSAAFAYRVTRRPRPT